MNSNYLVIVKAKVKADCAEEFIRTATENALNSRKEEGVISFDVIRDKENANDFMLIEIYKKPEDHLAHRTTEHYLAFKERVKDLLIAPYQVDYYNSIVNY